MTHIDPNKWLEAVPEVEPERSPPLGQRGLAVGLFVGSALFLDFLRFTYA